MSLPRVRVTINLDRPRTLVMSFNALCRAEEATGINLLVTDIAFSSVRVLRALVWAGLLHEDPTISIERVGDLIEEAGADNVLMAVLDAYTAAMPERDGGEESGGDAEGEDPPNGGS